MLRRDLEGRITHREAIRWLTYFKMKNEAELAAIDKAKKESKKR